MNRAGLLGAMLCLLGSHLSAAPANDLCTGAEIIPGSGPFPFFSTVVSDVSSATTIGDPGAPSCSSTGATHSVWYQFAPNITGLYTLSVSDDTATTIPDTVLALYSSGGGCGGPLVPVACNDDSGSLGSAISTNLNAGTLYYAVVWVSPFSAPLTNGHGAVQLKVSRPSIPANDVCSGAEVIPSSGPFPYLTSIADNSLAGTLSDPPAPPCLSTDSRSIWYSFTPATTTTYTLSTCSETATTVYDTAMAIYTGTCGSLTNYACNDDNCGGRAAITTTLNAGTTYRIVVWESGTDPYTPGETSIQIRITGLFPPSAITSPANGITSTGAVFRAIVNPNGAATTAWFDYGPGTNYVLSTAPQIIGSGTTNVIITQAQGLNAIRTNFFRVRATNILGTSSGSNASFVWSSVRPTLDQPSMSGGKINLQFTGAVHQSYLVLTSANLTTWSTLGQASDNGIGAFTFQDSINPAFPRKFYRILAP